MKYLWIYLFLFLLVVEIVHTYEHKKMELDVHGYCKQNAEHNENVQNSY